MLALLLSYTLTLTFNIQTVKASGTIYIKVDGSIDPPTGPIFSADNVTYTLTDNVYGSIVVERSNIIIDGAGHTLEGGGTGLRGIQTSGTRNVTIKNTNIKGFYFGVYFKRASSNILFRNNITNNIYGVQLYESSNNYISGNNIAKNRYGIPLYYFSSNNTISRNDITNNDSGVWLSQSSNNNISENNITNNLWSIWLWNFSSNNTITRNSISNIACKPYQPTYNIYLQYSSNNIIYHNRFVNNSQTGQVYSIGSINVWDNGYPSGGNHWSDCTSVDSFSGPYQNETGTDGITDMPYVIDENNRDRYPLMPPNIISFTVKPTPFSPNDDGRKDTTTIAASFNTVVDWQLQVRTAEGVTKRTWTGTGKTLTIIWDGKDASEVVVPDGNYKLRLNGADLSNTPFVTKLRSVTVDTTPPTVTGVSVNPTSFNPSLGQKTTINYTLSESCYVTIKIFKSGILYRTLLNNVLQTADPRSIVWDGKDREGNIVPPGTYTIKIWVEDKAGNRAAPFPIPIRVTVLA